jgi:endoglucanase
MTTGGIIPTRIPVRAAVAVLCMLLAALAAGDAAADPGVAASGVAGPGLLSGQAAATFLTPQGAAFLTVYVEPNGRVNRPDQGNDTVSEGQAYGLLLAETTGRDRLFNLIWQWTRVHLQLGNGLFAYHANAAGQILGPEPASDADLLIAWALLRYSGPDAGALHRDGQRVANAVLADEVTAGAGGMPILTAGPWATGRPATLDPSYWSLPAMTGLARLTGDQEWQQLAESAELLTRQLTQGGRLLPPDWAELTAAGEVFPASAPNGSASQPQYGLDAQRTVAWFAASCDPRARSLAARWWPLLRVPARYQALALQLDGTVLIPTRGVLPLVAAASAADAAGASAASLRLLSLAAGQQRHYPGYYGGAWSALGSILIRSHALDAC